MLNNKEPIMEFSSLEQAYECLIYWKNVLYLNDWVIKLELVPLRNLDDCQGWNNYELIHKAAYIKLGQLDSQSPCEMLKMSQELTLIHELLHCVFVLTDGASDTTEGEFMGMQEHQLVEMFARSLLMTKYNLSPNWFKNFNEKSGI